ncbi:hypothetical protein C8R43DRAFT_953617 [Mycena crocata]|nr:hypothetical protein C8R43DRAFT_953617 [Mycena crocata]
MKIRKKAVMTCFSNRRKLMRPSSRIRKANTLLLIVIFRFLSFLSLCLYDSGNLPSASRDLGGPIGRVSRAQGRRSPGKCVCTQFPKTGVQKHLADVASRNMMEICCIGNEQPLRQILERSVRKYVWKRLYFWSAIGAEYSRIHDCRKQRELCLRQAPADFGLG